MIRSWSVFCVSCQKRIVHFFHTGRTGYLQTLPLRKLEINQNGPKRCWKLQCFWTSHAFWLRKKTSASNADLLHNIASASGKTRPFLYLLVRISGWFQGANQPGFAAQFFSSVLRIQENDEFAHAIDATLDHIFPVRSDGNKTGGETSDLGESVRKRSSKPG